MQNCFILGSGRGGTSMLAGVVASAGYHLGDDLIQAREANPKGFFEDRVVNTINEDLLHQVVPDRPSGRITRRLYRSRTRYGQRWLAALPVGTEIPLPDAIRERIEALESRTPFCYKDPRFCYTLPLWRRCLTGEAAFLCVFREPGRTATSVEREITNARYLNDLHISHAGAIKVWTQMFLNVIDQQRSGGDWLFLHYDQILDGSGLDRIDALLGTTVDRDFADPNLKRSPDDDKALPKNTADVYARLCDLAGYEP